MDIDSKYLLKLVEDNARYKALLQVMFAKYKDSVLSKHSCIYIDLEEAKKILELAGISDVAPIVFNEDKKHERLEP